MIDFTAQQRQTISFFNLLARYTTTKIDLHLIQHEALLNRALGKKLVLASNVDIASAYKILKQENAFWKNKVKLENVYWSWSKEQQTFNIAFVDDVEKIEQFKAKNHLCFIQTSKTKYQAFFLLSNYVDANKLQTIQKTLQIIYGGDKASVGTYQLHRLVGFTNTKHQDNFIVKTVFTGTNKLNVSDVLEYYYKNIEPPKQQIKSQKPQLQIISSNNKQAQTKAKKTWQDFFDNDNSSTDFRYALYLLHFYSPEQVYDILLNESPDLVARKGAYAGDYLKRTISKALEYFTSSTNNSSTN
jgi:hypothetical protein